MSRIQTKANSPPWALAGGLLAACLVTLIGVCLNHEPITILTRACGAGMFMGLTFGVLAIGWRALKPVEEDD